MIYLYSLPAVIFERSIKINFFINMRSMMEMNKLTIKSYFNFIHMHASKNSYFFKQIDFTKNWNRGYIF